MRDQGVRRDLVFRGERFATRSERLRAEREEADAERAERTAAKLERHWGTVYAQAHALASAIEDGRQAHGYRDTRTVALAVPPRTSGIRTMTNVDAPIAMSSTPTRSGGSTAAGRIADEVEAFRKAKGLSTTAEAIARFPDQAKIAEYRSAQLAEVERVLATRGLVPAQVPVASDSPVRQFDALVQQYQKEHRCTYAKAICAVGREHRELAQARNAALTVPVVGGVALGR